MVHSFSTVTIYSRCRLSINFIIQMTEHEHALWTTLCNIKYREAQDRNYCNSTLRIRSHDNFFKSLDKVSKYQIKGDGKQSRINCLDRKIRYQGHASKKIYGFLHSTYNFRWQIHNPTFQTLFFDFYAANKYIFFFKSNVERVYNVIPLYI